MDPSEFSPYPIVIVWENQELELKPFDLRAITWAERFYFLDDQNGLERMHRILKNEEGEAAFQNAVIDIIHHLSCGGFGIQASELKESVRAHEDRINIFNGFTTALNKTFSISFPQKKEEPELTGGAIFQFFKDMEDEKGKPESKTNWAQIYTKFYAAGGMTIDQFYGLTLKQIELINEELVFVNAESFRDNAAVHGIPANKIKMPRRKGKVDFSESNIADLEKHMVN